MQRGGRKHSVDMVAGQVTRRHVAIFCVALLACALAALDNPAIRRAAAQAKSSPVLSASVVRASPGTVAPLNISLNNESAVPRQAMLVFRGLPPGMRFNEGRLFGPGVWVVPANGAGRVAVFVPLDAAGEISLKVALETLDGEVLTSTRIVLAITAQPDGQNAVPVSAKTGPEEGERMRAARPSQLAPEDRVTAQKLVQKAEEYMKNGSIILARRLYQGAADRGLAEAAYALAQTYDGKELAKLRNLVGVQADEALAKKWYDRASELGFIHADAR